MLGSLAEIKVVYQTYQRIAESPVLDAFLFKKIMPLTKRNCDAIFDALSQGDSKISELNRIRECV